MSRTEKNRQKYSIESAIKVSPHLDNTFKELVEEDELIHNFKGHITSEILAIYFSHVKNLTENEASSIKNDLTVINNLSTIPENIHPLSIASIEAGQKMVSEFDSKYPGFFVDENGKPKTEYTSTSNLVLKVLKATLTNCIKKTIEKDTEGAITDKPKLMRDQESESKNQLSYNENEEELQELEPTTSLLQPSLPQLQQPVAKRTLEEENKLQESSLSKRAREENPNLTPSSTPYTRKSDSPMRDQLQVLNFFSLSEKKFLQLSPAEQEEVMLHASLLKQSVDKFKLSQNEQEVPQEMNVKSVVNQVAQPLSKLSPKERLRT